MDHCNFHLFQDANRTFNIELRNQPRHPGFKFYSPPPFFKGLEITQSFIKGKNLKSVMLQNI
jgi:hypothetical protein